MSKYTAEASETIAGLRHDLALAREELLDLRQENDRLERILQAPLSLMDLRVAWEAAEAPSDENPIREGDVLIEHFGPGAYHVYVAEGNYSRLPYAIRILSRAPKREPWQDLADVLGSFAIHDHNGKEYPDVLARLLHERGVRVTGNEEER